MSKQDDLSKNLALGFFNSKALAKAIDRIPDETWAMTSAQLEKLIKPTNVDMKLKLRYWELINNAIKPHRKYTIGAINEGICSYTNLYNYILNNPKKVAWILKPELSFHPFLEFYQHEILDKLSEIIHLDIHKPDGTIDLGIANLKVKTMGLILSNTEKIDPENIEASVNGDGAPVRLKGL